MSEKRSNWILPKSGEVWVGKRLLPVVAESLFGATPSGNVEWRRVIDVRGGFVFYNNGGDHNGECRIATFRRWARENEASPDEPQPRMDGFAWPHCQRCGRELELIRPHTFECSICDA